MILPLINFDIITLRKSMNIFIMVQYLIEH